MAILYLHGAHGYVDDQPIAAALSAAVAAEIRMPDLGDQDMSHATWSAQIAAHIAPDVDTVVGHSFGGSTVLKLLSESRLAAPTGGTSRSTSSRTTRTSAWAPA